MKKKHIISPCVGVCSIDPESDLCIGCLRFTSEIAIWPQINNERAHQIMNEIKVRSILKNRIKFEDKIKCINIERTNVTN